MTVIAPNTNIFFQTVFSPNMTVLTPNTTLFVQNTIDVVKPVNLTVLNIGKHKTFLNPPTSSQLGISLF